MSKVNELTREKWVLGAFPEWGTWLNEEIDEEVVAPGTFAMWWIGCTGLWIKSENSTNTVSYTHLKKEFGKDIVFWGGGVDTQKTFAFGKAEQVREEVLEMCRIFSEGGGFVFNTIHNIQAMTPVENVVAMIDAVKEFNR